MCNASQVQDALESLNTSTLDDLAIVLGCRATKGTLSRILRGEHVSRGQIREVGRALGIHYDSPSTARRKRLRREIMDRFGITLEDAAEQWLQKEKR